MNGNPTNSWSAGTFQRDTLTYTLGALAVSILKRATKDIGFTARYRSWLAIVANNQPLNDGTERLLTTGMDEGAVTLFARSQEGEFAIECKHAKFDALIAVGFDLVKLNLEGILIAQFQGDPLTAIVFSRTLMHKINNRLQRSESDRAEPINVETLAN